MYAILKFRHFNGLIKKNNNKVKCNCPSIQFLAIFLLLLFLICNLRGDVQQRTEKKNILINDRSKTV